MLYTALGRSGLKVSIAALGSMNMGLQGSHPADEAESRRIISAYLDAGGNFLDTADAYCRGESEVVVGKAVKGRRDGVVIATKACLPTGTGPNDRGLSRVYLRRALDASLRRLGTDYIDLYQCHHWDRTTPIEETMSSLEEFIRAGKVCYLGCSNFTAAQLVESQWAAQRMSGRSFISLQVQYSLVTRVAEAEILPACERHGVGALAWSPLSGGLLAGDYGQDSALLPDSRIARSLASDTPLLKTWAEEVLQPANRTISGQVADVARELSTSSAAVAIAWLRDRPGVSSIIIGPRSAKQLTDNLAGFELELPAALRTRLDDASLPTSLAPITGRHLIRLAARPA